MAQAVLIAGTEIVFNCKRHSIKSGSSFSGEHTHAT